MLLVLLQFRIYHKALVILNNFMSELFVLLSALFETHSRQHCSTQLTFAGQLKINVN